MKNCIFITGLLIASFLACCAPAPISVPPGIPPNPTSAPTPAASIPPAPTITPLPSATSILPTLASTAQAGVGVEPYQYVVHQDLSKLDRDLGLSLLETLWFDQSTIWSGQDQPLAQNILKLGMNPGLGIRDLHAQGITGKGITVAIIDQPMGLDHPEYKGKIVKYFDVGTDVVSSMHGPAVTSLLVGQNIGTAPDARVYFVAAPSWFLDAQFYADALDWIVAENQKLPAAGKIRVVSVSAAPSGLWSPFTKNKTTWDKASQRAAAAGMLVLDATFEFGITSRCRYDLNDPDNVSKCIPEYLGPLDSPHQRIYIPASRRSSATEWQAGNFSYQYTGQGGDSWSIPYLAGVLAMGWQINPALTNAQILEQLYASAYINPDKKLIINPKAFIDRVRLTVSP